MAPSRLVAQYCISRSCDPVIINRPSYRSCHPLILKPISYVGLVCTVPPSAGVYFGPFAAPRQLLLQVQIIGLQN